MSVRLLQAPVGVNGGSLAYTSPVTGGSLLILASVGASASIGATDTVGNNWLTAVQHQSNGDASIYYAINVASGANTVTLTSVSGNDIWLWEVAAASTPKTVVPLIDKTAGTSNFGNPADPGSITSSYASEFLVSCVFGVTSNPTAGAAGWTTNNVSANTWVQHLALGGISQNDGKFTMAGNTSFDVSCAAFGFPFADAISVVHPRPKPFLM